MNRMTRTALIGTVGMLSLASAADVCCRDGGTYSAEDAAEKYGAKACNEGRFLVGVCSMRGMGENMRSYSDES